MSEKQFKLSSEIALQYQIMDNDTDLNESEVVDLLNKLYEENERLKSRIAFFEDQEDEFEQYTAQTIENMIADYRDD